MRPEEFIEEARVIESPNELVDLLNELKLAVAAGDLCQITPGDAPLASSVDITTLTDKGPWPDYLELHFRGRDGAHYRLAVETYHGTGGRWERVA